MTDLSLFVISGNGNGDHDHSMMVGVTDVRSRDFRFHTTTESFTTPFGALSASQISPISVFDLLQATQTDNAVASLHHVVSDAEINPQPEQNNSITVYGQSPNQDAGASLGSYDDLFQDAHGNPEIDQFRGNTVTVIGRPSAQQVSDELAKVSYDITGSSALPDSDGYVADIMVDHISPRLVRNEIAHSQEAQQAIDNLYKSVLNRSADPGGMASYEDALAGGITLSAARTSMAESPEAQQDLKNIISNVQGRSAGSGDSNWISMEQQAVASGESMAQVQSDLAHWSGEQGVISGMMQSVLGRGASSTEVSNYENYLGGGGNLAQVRNWVAYSSESQQNITDAYKMFLGRIPSNGEMGSDENALNNGESIQSLRSGCITSNECHIDMMNDLRSRFGFSISSTEATSLQQSMNGMFFSLSNTLPDNPAQEAPTGYHANPAAPPGSFSWQAPGGVTLVIPSGYSFTDEHRAGQSQASDYTPWDLYSAAKNAIGLGGQFDIQRDVQTKTLWQQYTNAGNYGVGVYMQGAGFTISDTVAIGWAYSWIASGQSPTPEAERMWQLGYIDAMRGSYN